MKVSRLQLLDRTEYDEDLEKLLDLIVKADLPEPKSSIIEKYREGRRVRDSDVYTLTVENLSTVASKRCYDMSNFDISSLHGAHKVSVTVVRLNNEKLRTFLADRLFNGSVDELDQSLVDLTPVLNKLRSHFIYLREKDFGYTEPGFFQPLYTLFLERVASRIGRSTCNKTGSAFPLSVDAEVAQDNGNIDTVTITGKTDIVKIPAFEDDDYDVIEFLMELKPPFGALFHATSDGAKGQLVSQLLGLWEMSSENRTATLGGLSDIFALMIFFAYSDRRRVFNMTKSVASAQEYLLHLMLLFCSDHDIRELIEIEGDTAPVLHEGPNEENPSKSSDQEPDAGNDGRKLRSSSRGATGVASVLSMRAVNTGTSAAPTKSKKVFSAEEYEASCEGESELQKWYARHNGLLSLSKENIDNNQLHPRCCNNV